MNSEHNPDSANPTELRPPRPVVLESSSDFPKRRNTLDHRIVLEGFNVFSQSGQVVGELNINYIHAVPLGSNEIETEYLLFVQVDAVLIFDEFKNQGYGIGLYIDFLNRVANDYRVPVISNHAAGLSGSPITGLTEPGSYKVWTSLVKRGLAHQILEENPEEGTDPVIDFISIPQVAKEKRQLVELLERYYWLVTQAAVLPEEGRIIKGLRSRLFPTQDKALLK